MEKYIVYARESRDSRRQALLRLAYPVLVLVFAVLVIFALARWIVPAFADIYEDLGVELPSLTLFVIGLSDFVVRFGLWLAAVIVLVLACGWCGLTVVVGRAGRQRMLGAVPLVGATFRDLSLSRFCHLLALLVESNVQMPEALRLTREGLGDPNLREGCLWLAEEIEQGTELAAAAKAQPHFPAEVAHAFRWERRQEDFIDILHAAGDMFLVRANISSGLIPIVIEPVVFGGVAVFAGGLTIALYLPFVKLLNDLT